MPRRVVPVVAVVLRLLLVARLAWRRRWSEGGSCPDGDDGAWKLVRAGVALAAALLGGGVVVAPR